MATTDDTDQQQRDLNETVHVPLSLMQIYDIRHALYVAADYHREEGRHNIARTLSRIRDEFGPFIGKD